MKLLVRVIEARNIPAMDMNGFSDPYVKLQLGKQRFRTKVVKKTLNPSWCEEFTFKVEDLKDELTVSVLDEDKYFNDDFVGQIKIPVSLVFDANDTSLGTVWHTLNPKNKKSNTKECGEILLTVCLIQNNILADLQAVGDHVMPLKKYTDIPVDSPSRSSTSLLAPSSPMRSEDSDSSTKDEKSHKQKLSCRIAQIFNKNGDTLCSSSNKSNNISLRELPEVVNEEVKSEDNLSSSSETFEEQIKKMESREQESGAPSNLPGGVLVDQLYEIEPFEFNTLLFSPDSSFPKSLGDVQGSTDLQLGPWEFVNNGESLKRVITYVKAASKLIKALKTTEEQTYVRADGKVFGVLASVSTPDAPYGNSFRVEVLYCISPGPDLPSGETCCRLVISWRMNFLQSVMIRGMIEGGARQGLKDSFEQYATCLAQNVKQIDSKDVVSSDKEQILASLKVEPQSDLKLAVQYFANFTVISTVLLGLYVLVHICLATPSTLQGLEFVGLDLPDSVGEVIVCGVLVLMGERVLELISRFMQARVQQGSDHGIKAQGDGWLLTVALIEGSNFAAVDSTGFSDPYVVFTCNGKTRTSSIKFQKTDAHWNEIFEFDAMDDPPSMLDIDVYDFDGPFDEATSLGHAEINFVRSNISDLADVWIPLEGKLAQACQSKLHLRIFLNNTRGSNVVEEYITKMEKEVGKKIRLRSPQTNSAFQKLFKLPPEEFLINDFTCHLKRRMPLQGRLFLSPRIIGFYADLFGHKTRFFFLWEDIEEIQVIPPTLSSMGSPIVVMTLRPGRGLDAKHGAKTQDAQGRLKFHFQSFVSFNVANKTIMALWKARALSPEQKVQMVEEEADQEEDTGAKVLQSEESGSFLGVEDVSMSTVYSSVISAPTSYVMELFGGGELERKVMERGGCVNYSYGAWERPEKGAGEVYHRQVYYRFDKRISRYGGNATSTQQKSRLSPTAWLVEEVMTLHGVPLGDYFNLHLRYQMEDLAGRSVGCNVQVSLGLAWLKSTKHKKRLTTNIHSNLLDRLMLMFSIVEKEYVSLLPNPN
jgi:hypothetical protein